MDRLRGWLDTAWHFHIWSVDGRALTVGLLVTGLLLVLAGFALAWILSRLLSRRVLPRMGVHRGATAAIEAVVFYLLLATFVFAGLQLLNVPLTTFAFLGGALAIGVGFGSQNIIENFISGLILLAERPVRVGDLIELDADDLTGTVERIGARSTRIRTGSNVEVIVPNSSFLQNRVVNWTLSSTQVRTYVSVGVAYGSPTDQVNKLLLEAARERDDVLSAPEPFVWFTDFGDNALVFELHFWIHMRSIADRRRIESALRYRIDELFRLAGIVIAFPQRDVHFNPQRPLSVQMLPPQTGGSESGGTDSQSSGAPS